MRVSMEYYMKRRNLNWNVFKNLEYDRYTIWCHVRKIIPVSRDDYDANFVEPKAQEIKPSESKTLPPNPQHQDPKLLGRKKKADLVEFATLYGADLDGSETKKQLVQLIIELNK